MHLGKFKVYSPDNPKVVELCYLFELHFGPMVCTVTSKGFELPQDIGEVLEFVTWSSSGQFLTLCKVTFDAGTGSYTFILWLIDTEQSIATEYLRSSSPLRVKKVTNSGEVILV